MALIAAPEGCEAEARNFFGRLLGLEEIEKPEPLRSRGGCWFKVGSRQLHIGIEEHFRPATKTHLPFAVNNIESVCAVLKGGVYYACGTKRLPGFGGFMPAIRGAIAWSSPSQPVLIQLEVPLGTTNALDRSLYQQPPWVGRSER